MLSQDGIEPGSERGPRNHDEVPLVSNRENGTRTRRRAFGKPAGILAAGALFLVSIAAFYRVRELLAMLLLFTIVFGVAMIGVFILWLIEEAAHKTALELETLLTHTPSRHLVTLPRVQEKHIFGKRP